MDIYSRMAVKIIEHQEYIIGPVALERARDVTGLSLDWVEKNAKISGHGPTVIDQLVGAYEDLFGKVSAEVCKEAAGKLLSELEVENRPKSLV